MRQNYGYGSRGSSAVHLPSSLPVYSVRPTLAHNYLRVNPQQLFVVQVFIVNKFNVDIKFRSPTEVGIGNLFCCTCIFGLGG